MASSGNIEEQKLCFNTAHGSVEFNDCPMHGDGGSTSAKEKAREEDQPKSHRVGALELLEDEEGCSDQSDKSKDPEQDARGQLNGKHGILDDLFCLVKQSEDELAFSFSLTEVYRRGS